MPKSIPLQASVITAAEATTLFSDLIDAPALVLAVSGGPDSTALMWLAARWRDALKNGPKLVAVTVDHGLRDESKREALDVARLAKKLGIAHRTLRWTGKKPKTGLPRAARHARYRLLADAARRLNAAHVLTAHTLDDQAETVIIRLTRGSGLTGLAAMQTRSNVPDGDGVVLVRPLLGIPKARLIATLRAEEIAFADDPTNLDPKYTRARLRGLMPQLAQEGLDAGRLALLARRLKRADAALAAATVAAEELSIVQSTAAAVAIDAVKYDVLPDEIALRLLGRAIAAVGSEGPVELAKLESLKLALDAAKNTGNRFRRTLAGAIVARTDGKAGGKIVVERAPGRKKPARPGAKALTKRPRGRAKLKETR
ncbi:MAG TPA: tRNA lysidine(34) synthetase TilS [Rhizomicrobium sp.]